LEVVLDEQTDEQTTPTSYDPPELVEMGTFGRDTLGAGGPKREGGGGNRKFT
jgi:hypothetical protein